MSVARSRAGRHVGHRRGHGIAPVVGVPMGWWVAALVLSAAWRFVAGQIVLRRPGRYDARWLTWAAPVPESVELSRTEGVPRSRWARRPGWHRQLARAAGLFALWLWVVAPTVTLVALCTLALAWGARAGWRTFEAAYYHRVLVNVEDFLVERLGWTGSPEADDPRRWVRLPPYRVERVYVAPLRSAVLPADEEHGERGGWLTRWWPWAARVLAPLATPIAETGWVRWLTEPPAGRLPVLAVTGRRVGRLIVRGVEASRELRAYPRVVAPDLGDDDAEVVFLYHPRYQGHPSDLAEVARVINNRLPTDLTRRAS